MSLPRATYRLQFRGGMTFDRAAALAPYWRRLGIGHLYASPIFAAQSGSSHGYDVVDFNRFDPALGDEAGFLRLSDALKGEGLGLILDFVPNHMAASPENHWWHDVLEWGRQSRFARHFDIDWSADKLLLPVLGHCFEECLARGELSIVLDPSAGRLRLSYAGLALPLAPASYPLVLQRLNGGTDQVLTDIDADPPRLAWLEAALADLSRERGLMRRLHEAQIWRLTPWRSARDSLTYRRFFEISGLVGLRVEQDQVFDDVHRLLLGLVAQGHVDGVRVDHVDGLAEPRRYLERLRDATNRSREIYIVVEKILEADEALPAAWPVAGTTGYEFISTLARLLTTGSHDEALERGYGDFVGRDAHYETAALQAKREILTHNLAAELEWLTRSAAALAADEATARPFDPEALRQAIVALGCAFSVYRTYVDRDGAAMADRQTIAAAVEKAKSAGSAADPAAIDFVADLLLLDRAAAQPEAMLRFAIRFQQTTGPVMAKAIEDTAFYRYNRLIALNEVGGDPRALGGAAETVHALLATRHRDMPHGLSATATHDTKRGEDARARLYALSEAPATWARAVRRWAAMNAEWRVPLADGTAPEPETEWLIYQALLGVWPANLRHDDAEGLAALSARFAAYVEKALKEAKRRTSWTAPVAAYERAVGDFAGRLLAPDNQPFLADFIATCRPFQRAGAVYGLVQTLLKLTAPGIPDVYQGTEFWDFSLVDPDNRRPVDFSALSKRLGGLPRRSTAALLKDWRNGAIKMRVLRAGLQARRRAPGLFADGGYEPLIASGRRRAHVFAFARILEVQAALTIVPRQILELLDGTDRPMIAPETWEDTAVEIPTPLQGRAYSEALSGKTIELEARLPLAEILDNLPVALLQCG